MLTELCGLVQSPNYIFGNLTGWWLGEADGRSDEPYVSVDRWDQELKDAGFTGVDTAVFDAEQPYQYCAAIVSQMLMATLVGRRSQFLVTKKPTMLLEISLQKFDHWGWITRFVNSVITLHKAEASLSHST